MTIDDEQAELLRGGQVPGARVLNLPSTLQSMVFSNQQRCEEAL